MNTEKLRVAVFPGSFDPFTRGHESIVKRGLQLFDRVVVGIGYNIDKHSAASMEDRVNKLRALYAAEERVTVEAYSGLTTDFAARQGSRFILRGVRSWRDFEYEQNMADVNRRLSGVETVVLFTEPELACVSSSVVRELRHYGADVSAFLPAGTDGECTD